MEYGISNVDVVSVFSPPASGFFGPVDVFFLRCGVLLISIYASGLCLYSFICSLQRSLG